MTVPGEFDEGQLELIFSKARKAIEPCLPAVFNGAAPPTQGIMTDERLMAAYETLASFVSTYGEIYLPLFERLHDEIQKRENHTAFISLARTIHERKIER